jgi:orotate phosphoribosyltransferase
MNITQHLFDTNALRICPDDGPFWYTSGTVGPYYINTHFLCGGEETASAVLAAMDATLAAGEKAVCPVMAGGALEREIANAGAFAKVIDFLVRYIKENVNLDGISYVSGGERRDWFFSIPVAKRLFLPHISIYKDKTAVLSRGNGHREITFLPGKFGVLHIADLITEASSYDRLWNPAINALGGRIKESVVIVDSMQGGAEKLKMMGITPHTLAQISGGLFESALEEGLISPAQFKMIADYLDNPTDAMRDFLLSHPEFIRSSLSGGGKSAERARLCLENDYYGIKDLLPKM